MMYSITEAIYHTYTTAAFLRVPDGHPWGPSSRRVLAPPSRDARRFRPHARLLAKGRTLSGRALTVLGAALQLRGGRLIVAGQAGSR